MQQSLRQSDKAEKQQFGQLEKSEQALQSAVPLFERAAKLDTRIGASKARHSEEETGLLEGQKAKTQLLTQRADQQKSARKMNERLEVLQRALLQDAALESVSDRVKDMNSLFVSLSDLRAKLEGLRALQGEKQQSDEASKKQLDQKVTDAQTLKDSLKKLTGERQRKRQKSQKQSAR